MRKVLNNHFTKNWILNNIDLIDRIANKRFPDSPLAIEATNHVIDELENKNWLQGKKCNARLSTYFITVVKNMIENFSRKKFGRPRPPTWIKRKGAFWVDIFKKLCLEKMSVTDVLESTAESKKKMNRYRLAEEAVYEILSKEINCRESVQKRMVESDNDDTKPDSTLNTPDLLFSQKEQLRLTHALLSLITSDKIDLPEYGHIKSRIILLKTKLKLKNEEQLLLKLIYLDGLNPSDASRKMLWTTHKGNSLHRRLLEKISNVIDEVGLKNDLLSSIHMSFVDDYPK